MLHKTLQISQDVFQSKDTKRSSSNGIGKQQGELLLSACVTVSAVLIIQLSTGLEVRASEYLAPMQSAGKAG